MEEHQAAQERDDQPEPLPGDAPVAEEDFTDAADAAASDEMDDAERDGVEESDAANLAQPATTPHPNLPPEQLEQQGERTDEEQQTHYRPPHEQEQARLAQEQEQADAQAEPPAEPAS